MNSETILIVEDEPAMLRALADSFSHAGYRVLTAADGEKGLQEALDSRPDLIVLDLMLPKVNGYEICRQVRQAGLDMPILMLTAKSEESDVVLGLHLGADDYVTKPFSVKELIARCQAFLRRRRQIAARVFQIGGLRLDTVSRKLARGEEEVPLTPKEFDLLVLFASHPGRAMTRDHILRAVWGHGVFVNARSVDRCVTTLREKIEPDRARPRFIQTVRPLGYRFEGG